jgi:hypothetical protein
MRALMAQLMGVVEALVEEHRRLLEFCRKHTKALVAGDVAAIESTVQRMDAAVANIGDLEQKRQQVTNAIATAIGIPSTELTVSRLEPFLTEEESYRLKAGAEQLSVLLRDLEETNELNRSLVNQSLNYLAKTMQLVASALERDVYGPGAVRKPGGHMFDVQA